MSLQGGFLEESGALFDRNSSVAHGAGIHGGVGAGANLSATNVWRLHIKHVVLHSIFAWHEIKITVLWHLCVPFRLFLPGLFVEI
jgi:hypothetical protein